MRRLSIAIVIAIAVSVSSGCGTLAPSNSPTTLPEAYQHCDLKLSDGWKVGDPPAAFESILAVSSEKGTLDHELGLSGAGPQIHEHWFKKDESHVAICRHLGGVDACQSQAVYAILEKADNKWRLDGSIMQTICLYHERRR